MKKKILNGAFILAILLLGIGGVCRYRQNILVSLINPKINVEGIRLMMTEDEAKVLIGKKAEYIQGFGGYELHDPGIGIRLTFLNDVDTAFYKKVNKIQITNPAYEILFAKVGDPYDSALTLLQQQGFKQVKEGYPGYWKSNMYVILEKDEKNIISSVSIGVLDRVSSSRVY